MNVSLTKELEQFVEEKVRSGLYNNASEVIRDGLRRLIQEEQRMREPEWLERELLKAAGQPATPLTQQNWKAIRKRGLAKLEQLKRKPGK
jgi:putative addiction module CopG family antidote